MTRVGPTAMTDVPIRKHKFGHTQKRYKIGGEHHQRRKAGTGVMCLQAKECQGLQKLGRGKEGCYLLLASGAMRFNFMAAVTICSDFGAQKNKI